MGHYGRKCDIHNYDLMMAMEMLVGYGKKYNFMDERDANVFMFWTLENPFGEWMSLFVCLVMSLGFYTF